MREKANQKRALFFVLRNPPWWLIILARGKGFLEIHSETAQCTHCVRQQELTENLNYFNTNAYKGNLSLFAHNVLFQYQISHQQLQRRKLVLSDEKSKSSFNCHVNLVKFKLLYKESKFGKKISFTILDICGPNNELEHVWEVIII